MFKQSESYINEWYVYITVILILLLCIINFYKISLKKLKGKKNNLNMEEQVFLDNKHKVSVVNYKNNKFIVVIGPSGVAISEKINEKNINNV